jgi:hypothetical protein
LKKIKSREDVYLWFHRKILLTKMISEILPEEKRRLFELEQQYNSLEKGHNNVQSSDIYMGLKDMSFRLEELDKLILKEPKAKRDDFKRRYFIYQLL